LKVGAKIENLKYEPTLKRQLREFSISDVLSGRAFSHGSFNLNFKDSIIGVSHWVSPKRTRSYPYARVYDTMNAARRVTIIPFLKDEGKDGDRDFIQWDTVSLMSLLGVYVILGYYAEAQKNDAFDNKITEQEFDYTYLKARLEELPTYKSDALHWNLNELKKNLLNVAELSQHHYGRISKKTGVEMHGDSGATNRINKIRESVDRFQSNSRDLAASAQHRESLTIQPKEIVVEDKATITINNYLGGSYFFTVDEALATKGAVFFVEKKHTKDSRLPKEGDVKDGFVKMMLFTNLCKVTVDGKSSDHIPTLGLTSPNIEGYCHSKTSQQDKQKFYEHNSFSNADRNTFDRYLTEAHKNGFFVFLMDSREPHLQRVIVEELLK